MEPTSFWKLLTKRFTRAGGLHAGRGPNRSTCIILANKVCDFLKQLSMSERIRPYVANIPTPHDNIVEYSALLTELYDKLTVAKSNMEKASLLTNMYLVLPDIPETKPEWLDSLERLSVTPKSSDIIFLIKSLATATSITFRKVSQGGTPIPVKIDPSNPDAILISPHYLKSEFTNALDRFHADVANANGRLKDGVLHLPPALFTVELLVSGLEETGVLGDGEMLTPHKAWPFIVASLERAGTSGPYWFLIRKTGDLSQLKALLKQAAQIGNERLKTNISSCLSGINAIETKIPIINNRMYEDALKQMEIIYTKKTKLSDIIKRSHLNGKQLPLEIEGLLIAADNDDESFGGIISQLVDLEFIEDVRSYWIKTLCEMCDREEDLPGILKALKMADKSSVHTAARKIVKTLDFIYNGPEVIVANPT